MSSEPQKDNPDIERIKKAAEVLSEHFDTVQIFATRHESGQHDGSLRWQFGIGSWFARYGQVREFIVREEELSRLDVRKTQEED